MSGTITWIDGTTASSPEIETPGGGSSGSNTGGDSSIPGGTISNQQLDNKADSDETDFSNLSTGWNTETNKYDIYPLSTFLNGDSSVTISGGKVNIKLGTPKDEHMSGITVPTGVTVSPSNAKAFSIEQFWSSDEVYSLTYTKEGVGYATLAYVDKNITITGTRTYTEGGETYTQKYNMSLKAGWNYVFALYNEATETITTGSQSGYTWELNSGSH
jgi:hypothetical protein